MREGRLDPSSQRRVEPYSTQITVRASLTESDGSAATVNQMVTGITPALDGTKISS